MGKRHMGVGVETTYGVAVPPTRFFEALSESIALERNFDRIELVRAYSTREVVQLNSKAGGDIEMLANYDGIGLLFEHLLGSSESETGTINTHTFPSSAGIPAADRIGKSMTIVFRRDNALYWDYAGMKLVGMNHEFGTDAASRMTWNWLGKSESAGVTGSTPSWSTLLPMSPSHVSIAFDGGSALAAKAGSISIENPLDEPVGLGSETFVLEPDRAGVIKVTGSVEVYFDSLTEYAKYDGVTDVDMAITITNGTESLIYNLDKCRIIQATPHNTGRERLMATFELEAFYNTDATENCQVILANNDATP